MSSGAYSTHKLVLMGLSSWLNFCGRPVKKVLELGCGPSSTPLFLNRQVFPSLESLVSMETNPDWAHTISMLFGGDDRLNLCVHESEDALLQDSKLFAPYDIALVDGATNEGRVIALPTCLDMARFVVLHDVQEPELLKAVKAPHVVFSVIESPWTAVMSKHEPPFGFNGAANVK